MPDLAKESLISFFHPFGAFMRDVELIECLSEHFDSLQWFNDINSSTVNSVFKWFNDINSSTVNSVFSVVPVAFASTEWHPFPSSLRALIFCRMQHFLFFFGMSKERGLRK